MPNLEDYRGHDFGDISTMPEMVEADNAYSSQRARTDAGMQQGRLDYNFANRTMPRLLGTIGAAGQFYGSQAKKEGAYAERQNTWASTDIQSGLQRQLDDFERRRLYSSIGLII